MARFQGLRQSFGKFEKDIENLSEETIGEKIKESLVLNDALGECSESLKYFQFWMEDQQQQLDLMQLPFKVGDRVGWEERRNHGTKFEYRVFRTGILLKVKRILENRWNHTLNRHNLETTYEYTIELPGKSHRNLSSKYVDLLTIKDLEILKKEYNEALNAVKVAVLLTKSKPKPEKKAKAS